MTRRNRLLIVIAATAWIAWSPIWSATLAPLVLLGGICGAFFWDAELLNWINAGPLDPEDDDDVDLDDATGGAV